MLMCKLSNDNGNMTINAINKSYFVTSSSVCIKGFVLQSGGHQALVGTCPPNLRQCGSWGFHKFEEFFSGEGWPGRGKMYLITNAVKRQKFHVHLSIVLKLLRDFVPQPPTRLCPCTPMGEFCPPDSLCHPISKPWLLNCLQ